jgi:uncharacterized membrane protein
MTEMRSQMVSVMFPAINVMSLRQLLFVGTLNAMTCSALLISAVIFLILGRSVGYVFAAGGLVFAALAMVYLREVIRTAERAPS